VQKKRVRIGTMAHHATLLTRNLVDFEKVPGLRLENWLD
jgi:predicted nucleic acid-binding protein